MMRMQAVRKKLRPRHVFRIARGAKPWVENVFLAIERKGCIGYGEASPNAFYRETSEDVQLRLLALADWLRRQTLESPEDIARLTEEAWPRLYPSRAAQCALDLALWDLLAKSLGLTVGELATGRPCQPVISSATLSIGSEDEQALLLREAQDFRRLKLKVGVRVDWESLAHLRSLATGMQGESGWALDANAAWQEADIQAWQMPISRFAPALIEQPLPPDADAVLRTKPLPCPVYADESCRTEADVEALVDRYQGINIKLVKCGGLSPALRMRARARSLGLGTMVGCMLESGLLIAAGLVAAQGCDWADLDGAWLLADDPFPGLTWRQGFLHPGQGLGFGVKPDDLLPGGVS